MDVKTISEVVSTVGFPIVMCLMMGWFIKYQMDVTTKSIDALVNRVENVLEQNKIALDQNAENIRVLMTDVHTMLSKNEN